MTPDVKLENSHRADTKKLQFKLVQERMSLACFVTRAKSTTYDAATAFEEGSLRTRSWQDVDNDSASASEIDDEAVDDGDDNNQDEDESDCWQSRGLEVVFRNESPSPLVLCWVSDSGEPHHFYRLDPAQTKATPTFFHKRRTRQQQQQNNNNNNGGLYHRLKTDHLEHTHPGHAFCLGYVHNEDEMNRVRASRSLSRKQQSRTSGGGGENRNGTEGNQSERARGGTPSIVVAGYRPGFPTGSVDSDSGSSSSHSALSRRLQLITISHDDSANQPRLRGRRPSKLACFGVFCLGGRRRNASMQKDHDSDDESDDDDDSLDPTGWRVNAEWVTVRCRPYDTTSKVYEKKTFGGWPCRLEPNWSGGDTVSAAKLERDIRAAAELLPPHARDYLRKHCTIWINKSLSWGPEDCPEKGSGCCYHPTKQWLVKNGLSGEKHKCVEINAAPGYKSDCDLWGSGGVMIHELSHAYHHGMLPDGYSNKEIRECYERAMEEGLYDQVEYHRSCTRDGARTKAKARAYAATNPMEYFAELSAAFLGGLDETSEYNKWYPYNRKQLEEHDPRAHAMLSRLWKVNVGTATTMTSKRP
eukprot:jgi/Psemu1/291152/fgenesh1_pg.632_\